MRVDLRTLQQAAAKESAVFCLLGLGKRRIHCLIAESYAKVGYFLQIVQHEFPNYRMDYWEVLSSN